MNSKSKNYFIISAAVHIVFFISLFFIQALKQLAKKENPVEVTIITSDEVKLLRQPNVPEDSQIVETDSNAANLQKDDNAKLLSEKSNTVKKQTLAKFDAQFKNVKSRGTKSSPAAQKQEQQLAQTKSKVAPLLNPIFDPYAAFTKKTVQQELKNFTTGENSLNQGDTSTTNDRVDDVSSDLITMLNTKEYKYYGFYHRIKTQLNQWWQPKVREKVSKLMRQGRAIASDTSKETRLMIVLNEKGTLIKIQVLNASGIRDLDDAAVEAFRSAAPFPNPPKGIVDRDGTVKIPWNFVIES